MKAIFEAYPYFKKKYLKWVEEYVSSRTEELLEINITDFFRKYNYYFDIKWDDKIESHVYEIYIITNTKELVSVYKCFDSNYDRACEIVIEKMSHIINNIIKEEE